MQYDTIEELTLELALYPSRKLDILKSCGHEYESGSSWFVVAKDGNCALFDKNGDIDDLSRVKYIDLNMTPKDMERINIPKSVKCIRTAALGDRYKLIDINMEPSSVAETWSFAFNYCSSLESITFPKGFLRLGDYAFHACDALKNVVFPLGLRRVGEHAFMRCSSLESIHFTGKTREQIEHMDDYPWDIKDKSIFKCEGE